MTQSLEKFDFQIDKNPKKNFFGGVPKVEISCHHDSKISCKTLKNGLSRNSRKSSFFLDFQKTFLKRAASVQRLQWPWFLH